MRIVTNGCFDLFHDGHKHIISTALEWAHREDVLILMNSDLSVNKLKGDGRPIENYEKRINNISTWIKNTYPLSKVKIIEFNTEKELKDLINKFEPDIILKGNDRTNITEIVGSDKWAVCILPRLEKSGEVISTTNIIKKK